jgi:hypothetical protein
MLDGCGGQCPQNILEIAEHKESIVVDVEKLRSPNSQSLFLTNHPPDLSRIQSQIK